MNKKSIQADKVKIQQNKELWDKVVAEYQIDEKTVTVMLGDDNKEIDKYTLKYLNCFVERKRANRAIIFSSNHNTLEMIKFISYDFDFEFHYMSKDKLKNIFDYYCYAFNIDNIAFTFLNHCEYNTLGRILSETGISEEEAVKLGVFWLRSI